MIPLGVIKACSNPECRAVLPADPFDEPEAGFWVRKREGGAGSRILAYHSRCKDCHRALQRVNAGIRRRGRPFEARVPSDPVKRAEYTRQHLLQVATNPEFVRRSRANQVERRRRMRRLAGIPPRWPNRPEERLPIEPLQAVLRSLEAKLGSIEKASAACGLSPRRFVSLRDNEPHPKKLKDGRTAYYRQESVSYPLAYRVSVAADLLLSDIWPDLYGLPDLDD